jgi:hypothetical protein
MADESGLIRNRRCIVWVAERASLNKLLLLQICIVLLWLIPHPIVVWLTCGAMESNKDVCMKDFVVVSLWQKHVQQTTSNSINKSVRNRNPGRPATTVTVWDIIQLIISLVIQVSRFLVLILPHECGVWFYSRAVRDNVFRGHAFLAVGFHFSFRLQTLRRREGACLTVSVGQGKVGCPDQVPRDNLGPTAPSINISQREHHFRYFCGLNRTVIFIKSKLHIQKHAFYLPKHVRG